MAPKGHKNRSIKRLHLDPLALRPTDELVGPGPNRIAEVVGPSLLNGLAVQDHGVGVFHRAKPTADRTVCAHDHRVLSITSNPLGSIHTPFELANTELLGSVTRVSENTTSSAVNSSPL